MHDDRDAMMLVRAELCERLAALESFGRPVSAREASNNLSAIRTLAAAYGMIPVVRVAEALERAMAQAAPRRYPACPTALYLDRLHDAIGCSRLDEQASEAMLASVSVRLVA